MRITSKILATTAVAASTILAVPAFAAGPYTITSGSTSTGTTTFTSTSGAITFNTSGGLQLGCDSGTADGTLNLGSSSNGVGIASISPSTFTNCVGPLGIPLDVTQTSAWRLNATGAAGTVTPGSIDQVAAHVSNPDGQCDFDVTGSVDGNFNSGDQTLNVTTPTNGAQLDISNVSGCFGLILDGDTATFEASYAVTAAAGPITIS